MKALKKLTFRLFFILEISLFALFYLFGAQGLQVLMRLKKQNQLLKTELETIEEDVQKLESQLTDWRKNIFYQEKIAREQLQMARPQEEIYFLPKKLV